MRLEYVQRACAVYCTGELLKAVQLSDLYDDSKSFVDMPMKMAPEKVLADFTALNSTSTSSLADLLASHFQEAGSDLVSWVPSDYSDIPAMLTRISDEKYREWAQELNGLWLTLGRQVDESVAENPERHSFLPRKHPFIVPGGRFRETYYWDSYFILKGLLACDMHETSKMLVSNLLLDVENFGFVPNGARIYYLDR